MPFIGYARLGEIVGKTEDEVRADKDAGTIDLDDFDSLVRYVASYWGWGPLAPLEDRISELEALTARKPPSARRENAPKQLGVRDLTTSTVRWKVADRDKTRTPDPYLDRVKKRK